MLNLKLLKLNILENVKLENVKLTDVNIKILRNKNQPNTKKHKYFFATEFHVVNFNKCLQFSVWMKISRVFLGFHFSILY